jgi:hypothetical protein
MKLCAMLSAFEIEICTMYVKDLKMKLLKIFFLYLKVVYPIVFVSNIFPQFKIDSKTYTHLAAVLKDGDVSKQVKLPIRKLFWSKKE